LWIYPLSSAGTVALVARGIELNIKGRINVLDRRHLSAGRGALLEVLDALLVDVHLVAEAIAVRHHLGECGLRLFQLHRELGKLACLLVDLLLELLHLPAVVVHEGL